MKKEEGNYFAQLSDHKTLVLAFQLKYTRSNAQQRFLKMIYKLILS